MIQVEDKHDCCGCTACASICGKKAIVMQPDEEGFLYPVCDLSRCIDCHLCEQVCPIVARDSKQSDISPLKVYALRNKNAEILRSSSSGGAFASIVDNILLQGGVIYGAEYNEQHVVVHRGETTSDGAIRFRGSKYVQSNINGAYNEIRQHLLSGRYVLFSGTPCQVEGLKRFLRRSYENLLTVDILCHGVPSPQIFADYIRFINKYSLGRLKGLFMKDKTFGWGYQNTRLFFQRGRSEFNTPLSNLWNNIYYDHIVNRPSCHKCRFTNLHRPGDLTIGDFWGIEKYHKEFHSSMGVSLLMTNTTKGNIFWEQIKSEFEYIESNTEECIQPVLQHFRLEPSDRISFWEEYKKLGFDKTIRRRYHITHAALLKNCLNQIINNIRHK